MDAIWEWWKSLSQGLRDEIIAGVILAVGGTVIAVFRKRIVGLLRRLSVSDQSPQVPPQQVVIKVEAPQPQLPDKDPEPPQPPSLATNLPRRPAVGFVARRDKEGRDIVARLKEMLTPESSELIVLWGKGGIGKTTLAAEALRKLFAIFAKRIVWTSADGRGDYSLSTLLDEIATQLGQPDLRRLALEPKKEEVRKLLAATPTLITLDNFETISPAEQTNCSKWIIEHAPCPALITTRQQISGAHNIQIDAMSPEEAHEFLNRLIEQAGNKRAFSGIDQDRIIQSADANPLVMQWIIRQIGLAQRHGDVLDELAHGEGDAAKRVFDRSFNLPKLSDDGRAALLALSLFAPSASREALAEVAGFDSDIKRLNKAVEGLAALCLVETTDAGERLTIEGLTRELAKAHLHKEHRADEFRRRFVAYCLRYAEAHAEETPENLDGLESEKDNLLNAMDVAFEMKDWASVMGIRFAQEKALYLRGYWNESIQRGEQAVAAAEAAEDEGRIAMFAGNVALIRYHQGEYDEARSVYQHALEIYKKLGAEKNIALTLHNLAAIAQAQDDMAESRRLYNESLEINKKLGNQSGIANTLHELGRLAQSQGEIADAQRLYNESLEINKKLGNQIRIADTLNNLAVIAKDKGEAAEAQRLCSESLVINKNLGNQSGIARSLHTLGRLAEEEGDRTEAAHLFREALSIFEKLGSSQAEIARESLKRVGGKLDD